MKKVIIMITKKVFFAYTKKKGGWDCGRHYEILFNGCIPIFENLEKCPEHIMVDFPKKLIIEYNKIFENNIKNNILPDKTLYNNCVKNLINYCMEYLTCKAGIKYIFKKINMDFNLNMKILFLSNSRPDYLSCFTLTGLKNIFKNNVFDYPSVKHIYKDYSSDKELADKIKKDYGYSNKGISYTRNVNSEYKSNIKDIVKDIKNKKFDLIIYGNILRYNNYFDLINKYYEKNQIILLCGDDKPNMVVLKKYDNYGLNIFLREIN